MATTKGQRIGIWVIVIFMAVGTIGSFAMIALANKNQATDMEKQQQMQAAYQADVDAYNKKLDGIFKEQFGEVAPYQDKVSEFDAASVTELATEDLKVGDGAELAEGASFKAFYIGWNPSGKVFDSSFEGDTVKAGPIDAGEGVIDGWKKGVAGMHEGGVRLMTIPSDLAYGEAGSGEDIPANTPLRFVVFVLPANLELPEQPEMPQALYESLVRQYGGQ